MEFKLIEKFNDDMNDAIIKKSSSRLGKITQQDINRLNDDFREDIIEYPINESLSKKSSLRYHYKKHVLKKSDKRVSGNRNKYDYMSINEYYNYAKSIISFKGYGIIEEYHATVDGDFLLMVDSSNTLQVIDLTNYKTIHKVNDVADRVGYGSVSGFIGSQYFYYITEKDHDYKFVVEKINSNKVVCTLDNFYMSIFDDPESDYLLIEGSSAITVFDEVKIASYSFLNF